VVSTIFVAKPENATRIFNLAASGLCPDGKTHPPDGDMSLCPGGKARIEANQKAAEAKAKAKIEKGPIAAKSEKDCDKDELYFEDHYGNKKCYPLGYPIQKGYVVCRHPRGWMDICPDSNNDGLDDETNPLPTPEKFKGCTFIGAGGQVYSINQGQSAIKPTAITVSSPKPMSVKWQSGPMHRPTHR
jgi:hypothetical protein